MTQASNVARIPGDGAAQEAPFTGFGAPELAYILSRYSGPAIERSIEYLGVNLQAASPEFIAGGASCLAGRGLLEVRGEELDLIGAAAVLAYALAGAEHWTEIGLMAQRDTAADGALLLQARDVTILMRPRTLGTWFVLVKDPEQSATDAVLDLAAAFTSTHPQGAAFLSAHTLTWDATLFLRRSANGAWDLARGDSPLWPESRTDGVDDQAARHALDTLLAPMAVGG